MLQYYIYTKTISLMITYKLETKEYLTINFEKNGASMAALIEENTIYLHSFQSVLENHGYMSILLKDALEWLKINYKGYSIYADCNIKGMIVSLKCGGEIRKDLFRIDF